MSSAAFLAAQHQFSTKLLGELATSSSSGNVLLSPISILSVLSMIYSGAVNETKKEFGRTVGYEGGEDEWNSYLGCLLRSFDKKYFPCEERNKSYTLESANKIFLKKGFNLKEGFEKKMTKYFDAPFQELDLQKQAEAAGIVNKFVEEKTHNKIKSILSPGDITDDLRILLVNALYFKSSWQERFNPILTSQKEFFVEPKVSRKVRMMKKKSQFIYHDADDLQLLGIPYSGNETYMFMILPKRVEAINSISSVLDGKRLQSLLSRRERQLVNVEIPRFKLEEKTLLNRAMEKIGLKRGFSDDAQFTDIANGKLKINKLLHKVFIETNEEGTEAAAATAGGMFGIRPSMPEVVPDFIANHPFIFFITTKKNDILFEGIIREIKN